MAEPADADAPLRALHRELIAPIRPWLPETDGSAVALLPHRTLHSVPFAALVDAEGHHLVESLTLRVVPSLATFVRPAMPGSGDAETFRLLAFGDPTLPAGVTLPELPGAAAEVDRLGRIGDPWRVVALVGDQASEAAAKGHGRHYDALHFAVHGLTYEERPLDSALVLASSPGEDGYLTAAEILELPLRARLVVMSACASAAGRPTGDGVLGLTWSFLRRGVPAVISSLWNVDDAGTAELMARLYRRLHDGDPVDVALRGAQLDALRAGRDAGVWAPFVLTGAPLRPRASDRE